MRVLENNEVKLEYEISPSGSVIKSIVTRKDNWEVVESTYRKYTVDKPLPIGTTYTYTNSDGKEYGFLELKIAYTVKTENSFTLDFKSKRLYNTDISQNLLGFIIYTSFEDIVEVIPNSDNTLEVILEKDLCRSDIICFDKDFFEVFSQGLLGEIRSYKESKSGIDYVVETINGFMGCDDKDEFRNTLELASNI